MKVSIIIPIYNSEKYLKECIDSALNQTYRNLEVIAVNDGSTDGSHDILKEYSDKITIILKEHGGVASALNAGIKIASGEWIKQLDSDDVLYPNAVEELVLEARHLKGESKNYILYGNHEIIGSNGRIYYECIWPNYNHLNGFDINVISLHHVLGFPTTTLIHKSAFLEYGFYDESLLFAIDYELQLRLCFLHGCRPHLVPKVIAKRRIHQDQASFAHIKKNTEYNVIAKKILVKLDPMERIKYETALKQFRPSTLVARVNNRIFNFAVKILPNSVLYRVAKMYHTLKFKGLYKQRYGMSVLNK